MQQQTTSERQVFIAAILTPYLAKELPSHLSRQEKEKQISKYGYDPNNFKDIEKFNTQKHTVLIEKETQHKLPSPVNSDIIIAGQTEEQERKVRNLASYNNENTGLLIARYSTFYKHKSSYTGRSLEECGYSFDIPKDVHTVKLFLTDDDILESILLRNKDRIEKSIEKLNKGLSLPILITSNLEKELLVEKKSFPQEYRQHL